MKDENVDPAIRERKKHRRKKLRWTLISIVLLLLIFRLFLPYIVLKYVNKKLANLQEYYGHVEDIDIALIRGAYRINYLELVKKDTIVGKHDSIPFFTTREIDLSVEWRAIFKGAIVGEIYVEDPQINFVKGKHKNEDVKADTADFNQLIKDLMPLTINHVEINKGQIRYIDKFSSPHVNIAMKEIYAKVTNISNVNDSTKLLPASLKATADVYEGRLMMNVNFDALAKKPTFDLNAKLTNVNLVYLNDFLRAYGNFDLKKGSMGFYTEFAAKDGAFEGYVKPIIKDLDIVQWNKEEGNIAQILWETLIGSVAEILQNQVKEQLATKIPIKGKFDKPEAKLWTAISYVLRNAFVYALKPAIDNTININSVAYPGSEKKTVLQKWFGKKDKKKDKKKARKKKKK